ncbi:MAG TPA: GreA/GreB family elongation factor [Steroidobacteraceae bacterium]|nr:GreA/GreB family elongation factor [Steroidobacteraceae bacterium]
MSRAFVRENDGAEVPQDLPERPVSSHPNFVTARGLQQIESRLHELEAAREGPKRSEDKDALARVDRELRYWQQRKATAKVVEPDNVPQKVRFGVRVTLQYEDGTERSFTLVGEDEADPAQGLISWISPIAQALIGTSVGDEVALQSQRVEIVTLEPGA